MIIFKSRIVLNFQKLIIVQFKHTKALSIIHQFLINNGKEKTVSYYFLDFGVC